MAVTETARSLAVHVRITPETLAALDRLAAEVARPRAELVRHVLSRVDRSLLPAEWTADAERAARLPQRPRRPRKHAA